MDKNDKNVRETIEDCKAKNMLWFLTIPLDFFIVLTALLAFTFQWEISHYGAHHEEIGPPEVTAVTKGDIVFWSIVFAVSAALTVFLLIRWIISLRKCRNKLSAFLISLLLSAVIYPLSIFIIFTVF